MSVTERYAKEQAFLGSWLFEAQKHAEEIKNFDAERRRGTVRFSVQKHDLIFRAIADLINRFETADIALVAEALERQGHLQRAGGEDYLLRLVEMAV